ncbi:hypothetical protein SAMN05216167_15120 [Spirosoma endophyticum]|uniref:Uncharacterized protein n=1 Tax=Spirosoma endophyticum TaxID=662367 RepID=A0A1I2HZN6_9BACT|nr:hypothetical protein SAMN05216167_15120 [Spirosoma endophyticum]
MSRSFYILAIILTILIFPIAYWIAKGAFHFNTRADSTIGLFALLCSGPLLLVYGIFTYFLNHSVKEKKALSLIGLLTGLSWIGYLIKALLEGESV